MHVKYIQIIEITLHSNPWGKNTIPSPQYSGTHNGWHHLVFMAKLLVLLELTLALVSVIDVTFPTYRFLNILIDFGPIEFLTAINVE